MAMSDAEINELFEIMQSKFNPEKAAGIDTIVQFRLKDGDGGDDVNYYVHVHDSTADVSEGVSEEAGTTFIAGAEDYANIVHGRTNAMQAFMQGKLTVKGDMGLAMKLQGVFGL
ncbi:MAG: SCP2 sterol-binding domain-containing protein [Chloroflexota bacterium]